MNSKKAFIIVDVQNDFCPGGALPIKDGDKVVPIINSIQHKFDLVLATQDWHPKGHCSFAGTHGKKPGERVTLGGIEQILWPEHCVRDTFGAELLAGLDKGRIEKIFHKGSDKDIDSYSAFFDNRHLRATGLGEYLKERGVTEVHIAGLALDYCVKYSSLDSVRLGFKTTVIESACRGIDLVPGDIEKAVQEMKDIGVNVAREVK